MKLLCLAGSAVAILLSTDDFRDHKHLKFEYPVLILLATAGAADGLLAGKQWIMGDQFTVADGYCLVFYGWGLRGELPMTKLANYTAFKDRMLKRPKVMKVLQSEKSVLVA